MDELTQRVFVESKGISRVKSQRSTAAQSATALLVERCGVSEGRAALHAGVFRRQRFWFRKASAAHRYTRNFKERLLTDAAVLREN